MIVSKRRYSQLLEAVSVQSRELESLSRSVRELSDAVTKLHEVELRRDEAAERAEQQMNDSMASIFGFAPSRVNGGDDV